MKGSGSTALPRDFKYGRYRYVTWDAKDVTDEDGNITIEYDYAEASGDATDAEMRAAVLVELTTTGEEDRIDEIMEVEQ